MFEIIPGILEKEWVEIEKKLEIAKTFASTVHIDIIDGKFASNPTFLDPKPFKKYTSELFFELHMMVEEPIDYLESWADAGFQRYLGHIENMSSQEEFVAKAQSLGEVGLVVDGPSLLDAIKVPYEDLDCILFMTIKAGFSGQKFNSAHLEKVKTMRSKSEILPIEVDGGVNDQTIIQARQAGANRFVATSFIFNSENPQEQYQLLQSKRA